MKKDRIIEAKRALLDELIEEAKRAAREVQDHDLDNGSEGLFHCGVQYGAAHSEMETILWLQQVRESL